MASETSHYGLQKLQAGDPLSTNDYAFTDKNMDKIDILLFKSADHHHNGTDDSVADPTSPPSLTLSLTGGNIPAGKTVRYKFSWVDEFGAETAASPEATIATPAPVSVPGAPTLTTAATGGTLLSGNYFYALSSYVSVNTSETPAGARAYITALSGATNVVTLTLPSLPAGADGFNIYRRAPGETTYSYLDSVDMTGATPPTTYEDDGGAAPNCNRQPPNVNLTNSSNSITITLPGATPTVETGFTWKLYRTYEAGNYATSFLVWVVEETSEGSGIITPEYVDVGAGTSNGTPPTTSEMLSNPEQIDLDDAAEIQGFIPPLRNHIPFVVTFAVPGTLNAPDVDASNIWICEFDEAEIQHCRIALGRDSVPASTDVIVDVNKYDAAAATPTWGTIYTTQANRPKVLVGESFGEFTDPDVFKLFHGDALSIDIDQDGGGATPTDHDLIVTVFMIVRSGGFRSGVNALNSYTWAA